MSIMDIDDKAANRGSVNYPVSGKKFEAEIASIKWFGQAEKLV